MVYVKPHQITEFNRAWRGTNIKKIYTVQKNIPFISKSYILITTYLFKKRNASKSLENIKVQAFILNSISVIFLLQS